MQTIKDLFDVFPRPGRVDWLGIRPERGAAVRVVPDVVASEVGGLAGDHYSGRNGRRHVTLIQAEHLPAVAAFVGKNVVDPADLRRNVVVSGLNLLALKGKRFRLGNDVVLEYTGECHPCSQMETKLGPGGYNAMRNHGGITARVLRGGTICVGDAVTVLSTT